MQFFSLKTHCFKYKRLKQIYCLFFLYVIYKFFIVIESEIVFLIFIINVIDSLRLTFYITSKNTVLVYIAYIKLSFVYFTYNLYTYFFVSTSVSQLLNEMLIEKLNRSNTITLVYLLLIMGADILNSKY